MLSFNKVSFFVFPIMLAIILISVYIDHKKKRIFKGYPFVSFLISCYNDGDTIGNTIKSLYKNYPKSKFELIVANDKSTDNSLEILKNLQKKYGFKLINNKKNMGKSKTLNNIYTLAKSELLWIIDADLLVNRKAIENVISRFQSNLKTAAVSCPYCVINRGFLATMQEMEYNMMSLIITSHNHFSAMSLWGGCLAIKKSAFKKVGGFSENMLIEDVDMAFKLAEHGMKVEHARYPVYTYAPTTFISWFKQKKRWVAGGAQCYLKHFRVWIKHPLQVIFMILFSFFSITFIFRLLHDALFFSSVFIEHRYLRHTVSIIKGMEIIGITYWWVILKEVIIRTLFAAYSLPYIVPMVARVKHIYRLTYAIPYAILYFPVFSLFSLLWFFSGVKAYFQMDKKSRAW